MSNIAREYIAELRKEVNATLKRGEQIDFWDGFATSRPTGESAVYWMLHEIRALQATIAEIQAGITTANAYPETVAWLKEVIERR